MLELVLMFKTSSPFVVILFFFIALFLYTKLAGPIPFSVNSVTTNKSDAFTVSGEGKSSIVPDVAIVNAGITANGPTVKAVQDQVNTTINKITQAVKAEGIEEVDIKTTNYSINPNYDYSAPIQRITGYNGTSNISIKIKELDKANLVIDKVTANGANSVSGISFEASDKSKALNEARGKAVADAKNKAQDASRIAGFTLGRLINYYESLNDGVTPVPYGLVGAERSAVKTDMAVTQIQPGSTEIVVTATLSYEIR
jgi:uncharacterized protein